MKTNVKALLLVLCAVAIVAAAAFGTLAYLTDTEAVTNTFTVGSVGLTLDEAKVNDDGKPVGEDGKVVEDLADAKRVKENSYHLLPGHTYIKDPTIHVDEKSEDCYLFVKVVNGIKDIETKVAADTIAKQMENLGWKLVDGVENVYVFAKVGEKYAISKGGNVEVFKNFTIDGDSVVNVPDGGTVPDGKKDIADYADASIVVIAYAVQKAGFENSTPEDIWNTAFPTQTPNA